MNSGNAIFFSVLVCHFLEQGLNIMFFMSFFLQQGFFLHDDQ